MDRGVRVAIVGAGPAGLYAAGHLLADGSVDATVDLIERLPTPWGLVRAGVAPDHPKIKSVTRIFDRTAADQRVRLLGHVEFGRDVGRDDLTRRYDAVIYTTGAAEGRPLGIPGERLSGSTSATRFVAWYNGHPDAAAESFDLTGKRAVVIGNGNVALDVARMLVLPTERLRTTDTADHALAALAASGVREVHVLGRRGPAQAAFTTPELRELGEIDGVDVVVDEIELERALAAGAPPAGSTAARNIELLRDYARRGPGTQATRVVLRFLVSPVALRGDGVVEEVLIEHNELQTETDGRVVARPTGRRETLQVGAVFHAVGYRGRALPGVPFDERRGVIPNDAGRVADVLGPRYGEYTAGWIKRGPDGVIGTNKKDALETVTTLLEDLREGRLGARRDPGAADLADLLDERGVRATTYACWERIDAHEQAAGLAGGRPRVKLTDIAAMLDVAAAVSR